MTRQARGTNVIDTTREKALANADLMRSDKEKMRSMSRNIPSKRALCVESEMMPIKGNKQSSDMIHEANKAK